VIAAIVDQVISSVHFILYVRDQVTATAFWRVALDSPPVLDVPGMTEFALGTQVVLGLMPAAGIRSLLGPSLPDPAAARGIPRAEIYLVVQDAAAYHARALAAGATELSALTRRSWGDDAAYIARNVQSALDEGQPSILTRTTSENLINANRAAACEGLCGPGSPDEYPFALTYEGGAGAGVAGVPLAEQRIQGGVISSFCAGRSLPRPS
jgi:hypothetical protein